MKKIPEDTLVYLSLQEEGFNIPKTRLDLEKISIRCEDLSRYRKALRVKIRALLKSKEYALLREYIQMLYRLAQFSRYIYGHHSCNTAVLSWQEELARALQVEYAYHNFEVYDGISWIDYDNDEISCFMKHKADILGIKTEGEWIQDHKPFLNPKDRAHFDTVIKENHA